MREICSKTLRKPPPISLTYLRTIYTETTYKNVVQIQIIIYKHNHMYLSLKMHVIKLTNIET